MSEQKLLDQARADGIDFMVVGALVNRGPKVLLLRRVADDFLGGFWEIPGGGVDPGESLAEALGRELLEETGLKLLSVGEFLGTMDYIGESGRSCRQFNFVVATQPGQPVPCPDEHDAIAWIAADEISKYAVSEKMQQILESFWQC